MTAQQIQFNRINPQFNQKCRILTSDLVNTIFFSDYTDIPQLKESFTDRINDLLDTAEQPVVVDMTALRQKLLDITLVKKVVFRKNAISLYLHDVICKPSSNSHSDILASFRQREREQNVNVTIPGLILNINYSITSTRTVFKYGLNVTKEAGTKHTGYTGKTLAHPHWISKHEPCLGDFEGAIADAKLNLDIPLQVGLLIMYLEQYNFNDPAGKYIFNWAPYKIMPAPPFHPHFLNALDSDTYPALPLLFTELDAVRAYRWLASVCTDDHMSDYIGNDVLITDSWDRLYQLTIEINYHYAFPPVNRAWSLMLYALQETHPNMKADDITSFELYVNTHINAVVALSDFVASINLPKNENLYFNFFYADLSTSDTFLRARNFTLIEYNSFNDTREQYLDGESERQITMVICSGDPRTINTPWDSLRYAWPILNADEFHQVTAFLRSPSSDAKQRTLNQLVQIRDEAFTTQETLDTLLSLTKGYTK